ncbi:hypothetical protein WA158_000470 [Blastocystis sp. Blastoise]
MFGNLKFSLHLLRQQNIRLFMNISRSNVFKSSPSIIKTNQIFFRYVSDQINVGSSSRPVFNYSEQLESIDGLNRCLEKYNSTKQSIPKDVARYFESGDLFKKSSYQQQNKLWETIKRSTINDLDSKVTIYKGLLLYATKYHNVRTGLDVFNSIITMGITRKMPGFTYENLIRELYKKKDYKNAIYMYNTLKTQNVTLSPYSKAYIINSYGNVNRCDRAIVILNDLIQEYKYYNVYSTDKDIYQYKYNNKHINRNQMKIVYTAAIQACCKCNYIDQACIYIEDMTRYGLSIDAYVYTPVITSLGINKQVEKAEMIFNKAKLNGCCNIVSHNALLAVYARNGNRSKLESHMRDMKQEGISLGTEAYNSLLMCYGNENDVPSALNIFNLMKQNNIEPSIVTFVQLIKILGQNKEYDRISAVIDKMTDYKLEINSDIYAALLDAFENTNMALDVYKQAKKYISPNDPNLNKIFPQLCSSNSVTLPDFPEVYKYLGMNTSTVKASVLDKLNNILTSKEPYSRDLILIADYFSPNKRIYNTITTILNDMQISWFTGEKDGYIYIPRDSITDFVSKENYKRMKMKMEIWTYIRVFCCFSLIIGTVYTIPSLLSFYKA